MQRMARVEALRRLSAYRSRTALVGLAAVFATLAGVGFGFSMMDVSPFLWLEVPLAIVLPVIAYAVFVRWLARRMGLICANCGSRALSSSDIVSGRCSRCGGAYAESAA
jgi:hypothetical protein